MVYLATTGTRASTREEGILLDRAKLTVTSCLNAYATMPRLSNNKERLGFADIKNGRSVYTSSERGHSAQGSATHIQPWRMLPLSANNCSTTCPGDLKSSCGGTDALVVYSFGTASEAGKSTAPPTRISCHTSHTDPLRNAASNPLPWFPATTSMAKRSQSWG